MNFPVVLTVDEDGVYAAEAPIIPGCISAGDTREEALENIRDAITLCLASRDWWFAKLTTNRLTAKFPAVGPHPPIPRGRR